MIQTAAEHIKQRRTQMLIHSFLYYQLDHPVIPDATWQRWADELVVAQAAHPGAIGFYDEAFADWTGDTGMHLPRDGWVHQSALRLAALVARGPVPQEAAKTPPAPAPQATAASPRATYMQASLF